MEGPWKEEVSTASIFQPLESSHQANQQPWPRWDESGKQPIDEEEEELGEGHKGNEMGNLRRSAFWTLRSFMAVR